MQRKATRNTRGPMAKEKRFQGWVKDQDCCVCGACGPCIVDHAYGSCYRHMKTLVGHFFVIPLCQACDDVKTFGSRRGFIEMFKPFSTLWLDVVKSYPIEIPEDVVFAIEDMERQRK